MAWFQNLTVVLKFLPLLFVGVVGWFFVDTANLGAFNASGAASTTPSASLRGWRCSPSSASRRRRSRRGG
jgi:amino acid transporter